MPLYHVLIIKEEKHVYLENNIGLNVPMHILNIIKVNTKKKHSK